MTLFLSLGVVSFASAYRLYFSPDTISVHLNCATTGVYLMVSGAAYNGYQFDILEQSNIIYTWPVINGYTTNNFVSQSIVPNYFIDGSYVLRMIWVHNPSNTDASGISQWWRITIQNSGFLRTWTVDLKFNTSSITKAWQGQTNYLESTWNIVVDFYLWPCATDTIAPTFGFTGWMTPHTTNYTWPQYNDRIYRFNLRDMSGATDRWFTSWYTNDWDVDRTGGTYYAQSVVNGSGIDLATFVMQVAVESAPDSSSFPTVITLTGTLNATWWSAITWSDAGLVFYPYDFIRNRLNRNYTWYALTGTLRPSSTSDIDGNRSFGTEQEVIMTGYVRDRANNLSNTFAVRFNHGAIPRSSNVEWTGLVQYCGPNGSQTIWVSVPTSDSGAYITKYNSYFILEPFKVYLHDDRAGIDTGTITVYLSGTQNGTRTWITLTVASSEISLTPFSRVGPISIATAGNGTQSVYSAIGSTRNYETLVDYTGQRDPETRIEISINYKDLVGRTWTQVSCNYYNTYAPYANNRTSDVHLNRTPFSSGARLSGLTINVEDERAGVDSWTLVLTISGRTINDIVNRTTAPVSLVFSWASLSSRLTAYPTHTWAINGSQQYNYLITIPENADFTWYFAPEHPFAIIISYTDFAGHTQTATKQFSNIDNGSNYAALYGSNVVTSAYTNTNSLLININENPLLRRFSAITDPINRLEAFSLGTYSTTSGNTQFTGLSFAIMDHRAGVDGDYNLVVVTGSRRWSLATYVFATPTSTGKNLAPRTSCVGNCRTGDMSALAALVTDYDSFNAQHPTVQASTWYKYQITGHSIYFDYGVYGSPSAYGVNVYMSDLRPDDPNDIITGTSLALPTLACMFLDRCSHNQLTFVRWSGVTDMNQTIDMNPLTGTLDGNIVDIFGGSRVSVVGSWVRIDTWTSVLYCNAAGGLLDTPITLDFTNANPLPDTPTTTWYSNVTLKVADGLFLLSGDVLIVQ